MKKIIFFTVALSIITWQISTLHAMENENRPTALAIKKRQTISNLDAGVFSIDDVDLKFHVSHYNALPSVEQADEKLQSKSAFQDFLLKTKRIIVSHGLENIIGLRLIHRHFNLNQEQVMVENFEMHKGIPSLITTAHHIADAHKKGAVPSSWILSGSHPVVFEFSTDQAVRSGIEKMLAAPKFLPEIMGALLEDGFQDLLAVSISTRDSLVVEGEKVYLERNFGGPAASVVQASLPTSDTGALVTGWGFNGGENAYCVRSLCDGDYHHR